MTAVLEPPQINSKQGATLSAFRNGDAGYLSVSLDRIVPGSVLHNPIYDRKGVLLIKSGVRLTANLLEKLSIRNITFLLVHQDDVPYLHPGIASSADSRELPTFPTLKAQALGIDRTRLKKVASQVAESVDRTRELQSSLARCSIVHLDQPRELIDETFARIQDDPDLTLHASLFPEKPSYPAGQGSSTATLAMSMAQKLGFHERAVRELGIGCLLHDAGMLRLNREIVLSTEQFNPEEKRQVTRHVEASARMLDGIRNLPYECRVVASQIHERADGAGYPCRLSGNKFHPLARIAAVADCYVAMISPRLYRRAHAPYHAIENMLRETRDGRFDQRSMRALLQVVSLFPIGSVVQLSDGRTARVVRSNPEDYSRPVVEILLNADATSGVEILDLLHSPESVTQVVR